MTHATRNLSNNVSIPACGLLLAASSLAQGQVGPVSQTNPEMVTHAGKYWTAERFKAARPLPMPQAAHGGVQAEAAPDAATAARVVGVDGRPPSEPAGSAPLKLFTPDAPKSGIRATQGEAVAEPQSAGSYGAQYTSSRVFPMFNGSDGRFSADRAYPYIAVGKLFFAIGGSPFVCSASVIQRRVVVTAGHCVHSGTSSGFHSNFVFAPAFRDGVAPFKTWNWRYVITSTAWASGGGGVPNSADYAMIEFADQPMSAGALPSKLGNVTGWLGWQTGSLASNHTSKVGYPCNLDSCLQMQNVMSNQYRAVAPNNMEYGSDARGGSSGGPWIQNLQKISVGGGTGTNVGSNRVVGVTSYGYTDTAPKVQGASIPDSRWVDMWNTICARPGNCI